MIRRRVAALVAGAILTACSHAIGPVASGPTVAGPQMVVPGLGQVTAHSLPAVKFFKIPTSFSWPEYIANGPDGNLWFTEYYAKQIARITPAGAVTEFSLPFGDDVEAIVAGPDGNLWFTQPGANKIGRITTSGVLADFPIQAANPSPRGIAVGPDGNLWFAENYDNTIGRITTSGVITRFAIPYGSSPWEVIAGPDGNLWVTESTSDQIARFNPRTLKFLPAIPLQSGDNPWALTIGLDKNIWFTGRHGGKVGVVANGHVTEFTIPTPGAYPDDMAVGPDHNFWFTESLKNAIGRFDPATGKFPPRIVLSTKDIPTSIVAGPDGNIWFTNPSYTANLNRIGVVVLH